MSDDAVSKVAARLQLDLTPAQQQLLQFRDDLKKAGAEAAAAVESNGAAQQQAQDKANQKLQQSQQMHQERLRQIQQDGDLARVMAANLVNQQLVQQAEDYGLKRELSQKQMDARLQMEQEQHQQKILQSAAMYQERMNQLYARRPAPQVLGGQGKVRSLLNKQDTGISTGQIVAGMVGFDAAMGAYQTIVQGMKDIENGAAGLQQVFESQITTQDQLNSVTNDFVGIAQKYGVSISELMDGAKQWGRQYKDVQTAMTLTNSSTLLSVVDNVKLTDANRGLEATMNALGLAADSQASAFANSMRIVDSWSALAHKASVSADDLVQATERSAGAAHAAGVTFDQLQALITSGVRNTGLQGANIGNMLKTLFSTIHTDKAQQELKQLDISLTQVGQDGQKQFRPVFDVLLELSQKLQTTDQSQQQVLKTISGGVQQYSKVASMLSDYKTIIDAYATSLNSAGAAQAYAQVQMHTLERDITRLRDTFAGMAAQTDQNGLGTFLKTIVEGLTDLIVGFEKLPPAAGDTLLIIGGLVVALKTFVAAMNTVDPAIKFAANTIDLFQKRSVAAKAALEAQTTATKAATVATETQTATTTAATAATEAKTAASGGAAVAAEAQAASSGAVVAGLEAETVSAGEATAAFTALDVVSGGLVLVIGAVVTAIGMSAIAEGQATQAAKDHADALQQQVGIAQQQYNLALQKQQFMDTAIKQEAQLKKALEDTTLSAQNRNKIMNDMIDLYHAVGNATDNEALKQVNASNVKNQSLTAEEKKLQQLVDDRKAAYDQAIEINQKEIQSDLDKTNQLITDVNAHIQSLQNDVDAQYATLTAWGKFKYGFDKLFGKDDSAQSLLDDATQQAIQQSQSQLASLTKQQAEDQKNLADSKLEKFKLDTGDITPGDVVPDKTVDAGWGATKPQKQSATSIAQPFKDAIASYDEALKPFTERTKALDTTIANLTSSQQMLSDSLKYGSTNMALAAQSTDIYHQRLVELKDHQDSLHATNDQIHADMAKVAAQMQALNPNNADPTTLGQGQQQALQSLSQEYDKLSQQLDSNSKKWQDDAKTMVQATNDWLNNLYQLQQNGLAPLTNQMNAIDNAIKTDKASMSLADNSMKHGDTSDYEATQYASHFIDDLNQLIQKQQLLHQEADQHKADINELSYTLRTLDPTIAGYDSAVQSLTNKINEHKQAISDLGDQWSQTALEAQSAIDTMMQKVEDSLKAGYSIEQKQQQDQLKDIYDAKIKGLTDQKNAVDALIQSLQQQWQIQQQTEKLTDLQQQEAQIKSQQDHLIVGLDGKVQRTYDLQKVADLDKQIADQKTQIAHDAQIQQLQDQKAAIEQQIQATQAEYNQKKQQLDDYWNYRMQQDQLKSEADQDIIKKGYKQALLDAEKFASDMNATYATINMASVNAGGAVSAGLPSGTTNAGSSSQSLQDIIKSAGQQWQNASTQAEKDAIHQALKNQLQGSGASYNSNTGQWSLNGVILNGPQAGHPANVATTSGSIPKMATGGVVPNVASGIDNVLTRLTPGEIVAPSFADIKQLALDSVKQNTTTIHKPVTITVQQVNVNEQSEVTEFLDLVHSVVSG